MADYKSKHTGAAIDEAVDRVLNNAPQDGFSPIVTIDTITDGHRVNIRDKNGTKSFDVMDGEAGQDGKTPVKGVDYFDGEDGQDGADGVSPIVTASKSGKVTTVTIKDVSGTKTVTINDGEDGQDGVSVASVYQKTTSLDDGGENIMVVALSDGTMTNFTVKNGRQGSPGEPGADGKTPVKGVDYFDGQDGAPGADGERGLSVLRITSGPSSYTATVGGFTPAYRVALSTVKSQAKVDKVLVGDTIVYSYYTYPVGYVDANYVYIGSRVSIRGSAGATPVKGTDYYTAADKEEFLSEMDAVRYVDQTLTEEQKAQARANIGATGNKWAGKVASFLGDSITRGMNTEKTYHEYLSELVGFSACNSYGISGSTISNYYESMCNRVGGIDSQSDIIFVFGGTNDFQQNIPMGEWYTLNGTTRTINYDKTTFRGALTTLCEALLNKFPNKRNVLITPLHRYTYPGDYTELQANSQGLYLEDYVNAIKEAGKIYSIPVIDLYSESGLCPMNTKSAAAYFHSSDKLHPNASGHRVIADVIRGYLDRTYPMYGEAASVTYDNLVTSAEERIISGDALTTYDGVGYANNYRLSSSGVVKAQAMAIATGFMPVSGGDTIRIGGIQWTLAGGAYNYMCAYKSDYTFIGAVYGSEAGTYGTKIHDSCAIDYNTPLTTIKLTNNADIAFIRVSCYNATTQDGGTLIITANEEIT